MPSLVVLSISKHFKSSYSAHFFIHLLSACAIDISQVAHPRLHFIPLPRMQSHYSVFFILSHFLPSISTPYLRDRGGPNGPNNGPIGPPGGFRRDDRDMHAPQGIRNRGYSIGTFLLFFLCSMFSMIFYDCGLLLATQSCLVCEIQ